MYVTWFPKKLWEHFFAEVVSKALCEIPGQGSSCDKAECTSKQTKRKESLLGTANAVSPTLPTYRLQEDRMTGHNGTPLAQKRL